MRTLLFVSVFLAVSFAAFLFGAHSVTPTRPSPPSIDGAWVLSETWTHFMGIALVIKGDEFKYWFYSDAYPNDPAEYPATGKVEFAGDTIRLHPTGDPLLYDKEWHLVVFEGEICLLADSHLREYRDGKKLADDRLLYKIEAFDERHPISNRPRKRD